MTINKTNYETFFLLYVDRELDAAGRRMVEDFVLQHPDLGNELTALKQTIAVPPAVEFENKNLLFKEEKQRRVMPLVWWRVAAALIIVLAGAWFLMMSGKKDSAVSGEVVVIPQANPGKTRAKEKTDSAKAPVAVIPAAEINDAVRRNPGPDFRSPYVNPVKPKLNPGRLNDRKTTGKPIPPPANHAPEMLASENTAPGVSISLPAIADNKTRPETNIQSSVDPVKPDPQPAIVNGQLSTVNRQPSTNPAPPSTINPQTSSSESILLFNNKSKSVSKFFKKLMSGSPEDATADNNRQKIRISVFQFNLKK